MIHTGQITLDCGAKPSIGALAPGLLGLVPVAAAIPAIASTGDDHEYHFKIRYNR